MTDRRQFLIAAGALATAGCLDSTDECFRWGLSFEGTAIADRGPDGWTVEGVLRALFSPSSSIERPYDEAYTDVAVSVRSGDDRVGVASLGTVGIGDGESADSDCIDVLARVPFAIDVVDAPTRITADCAEFDAMCEYGDDVREYAYEGSTPESIGSVDFEAGPWAEWTNRARPCEERDSSG